jgi:flagellar hook-associated protein 3 FlgL
MSDTNSASIKTAFESINSSLLTALNGTTSDDEKLIIANEIESARDEIFNLLNDSTNGDYLFSGTATSTTPFVKEDNGDISYVGSLDTRKVNVEKNTYVTQGVTGLDLMYYTNSIAGTDETLTFSKNEIILDEDGNQWKILDTDSDGVYDGLYLDGSASGSSLSIMQNEDGTFSTLNTEDLALTSKHSYFDDLDELINALNYQDTNGNTISSLEASGLLSNGLDKFEAAYENLNIFHSILGSRNASIDNYESLVQTKLTHYAVLEQEFAAADLTELAVESQALENTYTALYSTISKVNSLSLVNYI